MSSTVPNRARGKNGGRPKVSPAEREAAGAARTARIVALHEQIGAQVQALTADPAWRAMLDTAAKFHAYSLNNQLLIALGGAAQGFTPRRVAGFTTWKSLGPQRGQGIARCWPSSPPALTGPPRPPTSAGTPPGRGAAPANTAATAHPQDTTESDKPTGARVLCGFRVAHVFDITQTDGDPLPEVAPQLLTGDAPAGLWDALAAQVTAHGYS